MKSTKILSIDFQKDFSAENGVCYKPRPCVDFAKNILFPYLAHKKIQIAEILSDYRQPRQHVTTIDRCVPNEWGYESEVPNDIKDTRVWIKCMNSPVWVRENGGVADKEPGLPYQDPEGFDNWLSSVVGNPKDTRVVLIGLTLDCCVLCAAQELSWRGYEVRILKEGTDTYSGKKEEKDHMLESVPLINWAKALSWTELQKMLS